MMTQKKRFLIACGGTGGHLFPGISVAQELKRRGHSALLLVSEKAIDARALEAHPELEYEQVAMVGMPRPLSLGMLTFLGKFWKSYRRCGQLLKAFGADAVLGMGGFTSFPPILAGHRQGLPTFIHESNAIPGKANRRTARYCSAVFLGLEVCRQYFPSKPCHVVGTPVRDALREPVDRSEALRFFGLDEGKRTLLITGGSQGAQGVNRAVISMLPRLDPERLQCLHLTGNGGESEVRAAYEKTAITHHVAAFCDRMDLAMAIADGAISRSGASSLSELAFFGIPSILIPYPYAAEDHQTHNARPYVDAGAAVMFTENDLSGEKLAEAVTTLMLDEVAHGAMQRKMREFSSDSANIKICDMMEAQIA